MTIVAVEVSSSVKKQSEQISKHQKSVNSYQSSIYTRMDVNFEEDQEWEEQAVVIAKRVEEEYQKEKLRSNQMQQNEDESTVRKSKRISKDKVSKEG